MYTRKLLPMVLLFTILCGLLTCEAYASVIFVVSGKVFLADGSLAPDGLTVIVENTNTGVSGTGTTGKLGPGLYSATLFDPLNLAAVTKGGHLLRLTAKDGERIVGTRTHAVTQTEANAYAAEGVDVHWLGLVARIEPTSLPGDGKSQATITITAKDSAGKGITDDLITVAAKSGSIGTITNHKDGTYTAVYTAPSIETPQTDEVKIASKKLGVITSLSVTLQGKTPPAEVFMQVAPDELTADGVATATVTVTVQRDGKPVLDEVVTIEVTGEGEVSHITNQKDGTYTAIYLAPTKANTETLAATATQSGSKTTTTITLKPGLAVSLDISASRRSLAPDGVSQSLLTAIIKDAYGNPVDGETVVFAIKSGKGSLGAVTAQAQGRYTATYTAPEAQEPSEVLIRATTTAPISGETTIDLLPEVALIIAGTVFEADGQTTIFDGLLADVRMPDLDITGRALTAAGRYEVSFVDPAQTIAVGKLVRATIRSADGEVIYGNSEAYKLTETDLQTKRLELNILLDRTSGFTIYGTVTKVDDETPIFGATVAALDKNAKTSGSGSYALEFNDFATNPREGERLSLSLSTPAGASQTEEITVNLAERQMKVDFSLDITPPIAAVGADQFVKSGATVSLDGSNSTDNTQIKSYNWDFDATDGIGADATGVIVSTSYADEGIYLVTLTVVDQDGNEAQSTLTVTVDKEAVIEYVAVEGSPAATGNPIKVTAVAEPYGTARFSLAGIDTATHLPMAEDPKGQYVGEYFAQAGDNATDALVTVTFTDRAGNQTTDASQKASIDTIPPPPPKALAVTGDLIEQTNVTAVEITGKATAKKSISVTLSDDAQNTVAQEVTTDDNGAFKVNVDVSALQDGTITVTAAEGKDTAGNSGLPAAITVRKDLSPPAVDFIIKAMASEQTSEAGGQVAYLIEITGKNGFNAPVELNTLSLPTGVEAKFEPTTLTPTVEQPTQTSQLTLTLPTTIAEGEHQFSVLGLAAEGMFRKTLLTLSIQKLRADILLRVKPTEGKLHETMAVLVDVILYEPDDRESVEVTLNYISPAGETIPTAPAEAIGTAGAFEYDAPFTPDEMGEWRVTAKFAGDNRYKQAERSSSFQVGKGISSISFLDGVTEEAKKMGDTLSISGQLSPKLKGENISLILAIPGEPGSIKNVTSAEFGIFAQELELKVEGNWEIKARWSGNDQYETAESDTLAIEVVRGIGKFILVQGGGDEAENEAWDTFSSVVTDVYDTLLKTTFAHEDIYYLSPAQKPGEIKDRDGVPIVDATTAIETLKAAIERWAAPQVNPDMPLYIYLLSHNFEDEFLLAKNGKEDDMLTPEMLDEWLNALKDGTPVTIIIEACYSGGFIRDAEGNVTALCQEGRTIITSARYDKQSFIRKGSSFSHLFFDGIERNRSVKETFDRAEKRAKNIPYHSQQFPQLDANSNGVALESFDYAAVEEMYIPAELVSLPIFPEIYNISDTQTLLRGESDAKIWVEVGGGNTTKVWAFITPPSFEPAEKFASWTTLAEQHPEIELFDPDGDGIYETSYDGFTEPGEYAIVVYAQNSEGVKADPVQTTVMVFPAWDVNGDEVVDLSDVVIVGRHLGEDTPAGDVNGDGIVTIADLVLVSRHFGETYGN